MKKDNLSIGRWGEAIAKKYLENKGYRIMEQNYRTKYAEIDLIAWDRRWLWLSPTLVFIEVRTKIGERFGSPEESFNREKINKITRNAAAYIIQNLNNSHACYRRYRIDAICIVLDEKKNIKRLNHYQNITFLRGF